MATQAARPEIDEALPPEESTRRLIQASGKYIRGEMSVEDFEAAERRYTLDYRSVLKTLAERQRRFGPGRLRRFAEGRAKSLSIG